MRDLQKTPLFEIHKMHGARLVPFAGFEMPVQYTSIVSEHLAVRESAGLFDISHMGQIHVTGRNSAAELERLVTCKIESLRPGHVRYGCLCNEEGGVIDDVTVYRLAEDAFFLCINAANIVKDRIWIERQIGSSVKVTDRSAETALLALQGPSSERILATIEPDPVPKLHRFQFSESVLCKKTVLISRTGYTGSLGFELFVNAEDIVPLWNTFLAQGAALGLLAAGLGARDTLRLEAAFPLYGHELTEKTSPLEARLDRFVKLDEGGFIGAEAIRLRRDRGHPRLLVGFELLERGIAREGYNIELDGEVIGHVTSGGPSPSLHKAIGLGYVPPTVSNVGSEINVRIRDRSVPARIIETPFIKTS